MSAAKDLARRRKNYTMGDYIPTPEDYAAMRYCINNRICKISPLAKGNKNWYLEVYTNGKWNRSPETFGPGEVWEVLFKYYHHYYNKHKK